MTFHIDMYFVCTKFLELEIYIPKPSSHSKLFKKRNFLLTAKYEISLTQPMQKTLTKPSYHFKQKNMHSFISYKNFN